MLAPYFAPCSGGTSMSNELTATVNGARIDESIDSLLFEILDVGVSPGFTSSAQCKLCRIYLIEL